LLDDDAGSFTLSGKSQAYERLDVVRRGGDGCDLDQII
jgi:hypothetical protein